MSTYRSWSSLIAEAAIYLALLGVVIGFLYYAYGGQMSNLDAYIMERYPGAEIIGFDTNSALSAGKNGGCSINTAFKYKGKTYLACSELTGNNILVKETFVPNTGG